MKTVYICHPYSNDPTGNAAACREICRRIFAADVGILPMAPQCYLPAFVDDATQRDLAMHACIELMHRCDQLWVFGDTLTPGMRQEIEKNGWMDRPHPVMFFASLDGLDAHLEDHKRRDF